MHITIEISKATTKRLLLLSGALVVCLTAGIAYSALSVPAFNTGDTLNATSLTQLSTGLTTLDTRLAAIEGQERVARATLNATGGVASQTGSWISMANHSSAGGYVISFSPGVFSSTPTCVATAQAGNQSPPVIECYNVSASGISCVANSSGGTPPNVDTAIMLVCVGTK